MPSFSFGKRTSAPLPDTKLGHQRVTELTEPALAHAKSRIEHIAQTIPEKIQAEHHDRDSETGCNRHPCIGLHVGACGVEHAAPRRFWRLCAESEKGKTRGSVINDVTTIVVKLRLNRAMGNRPLAYVSQQCSHLQAL